MINNDEILNTNEKSVDPYDLHVSRCGKNSFKKVKIYKFHSNYNYNKYKNTNNTTSFFQTTIA